MVFSEPVFLFVFLPIALALIAAAARRPSLHSATILVSSLTFYYWSSGALVWLLIGCVFANWRLALSIERTRRPAWLVLGLAVNLLPLAYYKYAFFAASEWDGVFGTQAAVALRDVVLPVGISFFVFQGISYLVDVARRDTTAERTRSTSAPISRSSLS